MKKCAVFSDLSGYGKCSLTVDIPIMSVMGMEVHPVPTAILTRQTGYDRYSINRLTDFMPNYFTDWENEKFDAIMTGYIADDSQFNIIIDFIKQFKKSDTLLIVDPVMADDNERYDTMSNSMCDKMIKLASMADIITPNISELSILADMECKNESDILKACKYLYDNGVKNIIATGFAEQGKVKTFYYNKNGFDFVETEYVDGSFSGTGDILSAVICGAEMRGNSLKQGVRLACSFISKSIADTSTDNRCDGISFEKHLGELI